MSFDILGHRLPEDHELGGGKWVTSEHLGNLLLFYPVEKRDGVRVGDREVDAIYCSRVVDLDQGGRVMLDALVMGSVLVKNLVVGIPDQDIICGRLGQGQARGGNNPPWILIRHDDAELTRALEWLEKDARP